MVASGAGSAIVVTVTGGASACFDCFDLCWLVEPMHDLGKLLRCPNINRHNSLMSSAAVCVDLRHLSLKSQVDKCVRDISHCIRCLSVIVYLVTVFLLCRLENDIPDLQ